MIAQAFSWVVAQCPSWRTLISQRTAFGSRALSGETRRSARSTRAVVRRSVFIQRDCSSPSSQWVPVAEVTAALANSFTRSLTRAGSSGSRSCSVMAR